jgi:two-component system NtrC family response regulator/two-component system response regulator AtoC
LSDPLRVLVVEDDPALSDLLCEALDSRGHVPSPASRVGQALEQLRASEFDVAMVDLELPDGSGIDVLRSIKSDELATECIVLTGHADVATAIAAMKLGAYDYLSKPARLDEIEVVVQKAAEKARLRTENTALRLRLERHDRSSGLVTDDPAMKELLRTLQRVAPSDLPVLVEGETGTGKELVAHAVHEGSPRAAGPFVAVNCGAVPENLVESELFGHEKGAFTGAVARKPGVFELADHGTLFLDEIGELPASAQVKLLRALETKELRRVGATRTIRVDIRIVSATNRDLRVESAASRFREDLYFRLSGMALRLPPLRERRGDVAMLSAHFLRQFAPRKSISPAALNRLQNYPWPGNVRELQMVIQRAAILSANEEIGHEDVLLDPPQNWRATALRSGLTLEQVEGEYIQTVLAEHGGHRGKAAKALGIDPKTLYNKLASLHPKDKGDGSQPAGETTG